MFSLYPLNDAAEEVVDNKHNQDIRSALPVGTIFLDIRVYIRRRIHRRDAGEQYPWERRRRYLCLRAKYL